MNYLVKQTLKYLDEELLFEDYKYYIKCVPKSEIGATEYKELKQTGLEIPTNFNFTKSTIKWLIDSINNIKV